MSDFEYFKPYEGDKPYIFISYAHADDDAGPAHCQRHASPRI